MRQPQNPDGLENPKGAQRIGIGCVFRCLKTDRHMALGAQVVDLIGLDLLDDLDQIAAVREISVVENQSGIHIVGILVQMIDPAGVEAAGPSFDPMNDVSLLQQQFGQVTAVLAGDSADQGDTGLAGAVSGHSEISSP